MQQNHLKYIIPKTIQWSLWKWMWKSRNCRLRVKQGLAKLMTLVKGKQCQMKTNGIPIITT